MCLLIPIAAAAQPQRAMLSLLVNGVTYDDVLVVLRPGDLLVPADALAAAGLDTGTGVRESVDGREFVSLTSLAPGSTYILDERDVRLLITATAEMFVPAVRDLRPGPPPGILYASRRSAFVNYGVQAGAQSGYQIATELGVSAGGASFYSAATRTASSTLRGLTNLTFDRRSRRQRWILGDSFVTTGPLGGDALLAGLTVGSEFSLDPYFVRYPRMSLSTPVSVPSIMELYVNGRLVSREPVAPGRIDVRDIPLVAGQNDTRLVVRDPFGGSREVTSGFYQTSSALGDGVHDYQYGIGWRRRAAAVSSWSYGTPAATARHRVGLSNALTGGIRLEAAPGLFSGGPSLNLRLPVGELEVAAGGSRDGRQSGYAAHASYMYLSRRVNAGVQLGQASGSYLTLSRGVVQPTSTFNGFLAVPVDGISTVTIQHTRSTRPGSRAEHRTSGSTARRLTRQTELVASASWSRRADGGGGEISLGVTVMLGSRHVGSVSAQRSSSTHQAVVDLQRPLPVSNGAGYQVQTHLGDRASASGMAQYRGTHGLYEVRHAGFGGAPGTTVNVSGGLVAIAGGIYATRAIRESYALVQVPGVRGVRALSSQREAGRTDRRGNLLIPDLLPYYGNRLSITDSDIPLDYDVRGIEVTLAPPFRGGAVARFAVERIQRFAGAIVLETGDGHLPLAHGTLALTEGSGTPVTSPLGARGEFYFENLRPGRHSGTVTHALGSCAVDVDVPAVADATVSLGRLPCAASEK